MNTIIIGFLIGIFAFIGGILAGLVLAKKNFKKQLKNNPPITKEQIRQMYQKMGRKPSESQINQIVNSFKKNQD